MKLTNNQAQTLKQQLIYYPMFAKHEVNVPKVVSVLQKQLVLLRVVAPILALESNGPNVVVFMKLKRLGCYFHEGKLLFNCSLVLPL